MGSPRTRLFGFFAVFLLSVVVATALDNREDDYGTLQAQSAAAAAAAAEAEAAAMAAEAAVRNQGHRAKQQILHNHAHKHKFAAQAPSTHTHAAAPAAAPAAAAPSPSALASVTASKLVADDNGVTKPWQFASTGYTVTMSWIAFCIIFVISMFLGGLGGWCVRRSCGERKSREFTVNTDAHNLY